MDDDLSSIAVPSLVSLAYLAVRQAFLPSGQLEELERAFGYGEVLEEGRKRMRAEWKRAHLLHVGQAFLFERRCRERERVGDFYLL